jgi:uncharacterized protein
VLVALGLANAMFLLAMGAVEYRDRTELMHVAAVAEHKQAAHTPLTVAEKDALADWRKRIEQRRTLPPELKPVAEAEKAGHAGGVLAYLGMNIGLYVGLVYPSLLPNVAEAFCTMLLGVALWKWGVIQGQRSTRFYLVLMLACYVPGFALRAFDAQEYLRALTLPLPRIGWMTQEFARVAMSIGHVALVNLAVRSAAGAFVLAPFKAAGRTAFSLYFMQQIIALWILFAPWGPGLWNTVGWAEMAAIALAMIAFQLVVANLWLRAFASGPLEWAWRSLAYLSWQPFRRRPTPATSTDAAPAAA